MKRVATALFLVCATFLFFAGSLFAQLTGTKNIPGDYATLSAAITDLNTVGVGGGGVTFNVAAGFTETLPTLTSGLITATGTAGNPIVFQKSGGGANPLITAFSPGVSTTLDYIIAIAGGDYITFDGIDLQENASNTTATQQMEWGYALVKKSSVTPFDGCQNVTIKNCTITLSRLNTASTGIYVNNHISTATTALTITATTDAHNNNKFYHNTIQNCNTGIFINGFSDASPYALYDQNNDIGGTSAGTGNTIQNFGGTATTAYGVYGNNQNGLNVRYNTIADSVNASGVSSGGTLYGIFHGTGTNSSPTLSNNTVTITKGANTSTVYGIESDAGGTGTTTISNNTFQNWTCNGSSGVIYFINSVGTTGTVTISNNNISSNTTLNTTGTIYGIYNSNSTNNITVSSNTINNISKTGAGGTFYGYYNFGSPGGGTSTHSGNNFSNITLTGATTFYGIYQATSTSQVEVFTNNTISNITGGSSALYGLYHNYGAVGSSINGNTVSNLGGTSTIYGINIGSSVASLGLTVYGNTVNTLSTTGAATVYGIYYTYGTSTSIYNNNIYDLQANNATGVVYGLAVIGGTAASTHTIYNNFISDLRAPSTSSASDAVRGISITSASTTATINVYYNSIDINASSSGVNFGTSGIYHTTSATATTATLNLRNNVIVNTSTPAGTGLTVAYRRSSTTLTNYASTSNNNDFYAGTPSATNLIFNDGTNSDQTMATYKARVSPADGNSFAENPPFINAAAHNLHMNTATPTQCESGAAAIAGITTDYDGETRNASTPDIGADEFPGTLLDLSAPNISYTPLSNTSTFTNRTLTATITDASGVPTSGAGLPRLYWKINAGSYTAATAASLGSNQYQFTFGAGTVLGDVVSYYICAQDLAGTPNVGASPGGASGFSANPPAASTPPPTPSSYTIVPPPLSGDYTVGVALFNRTMGKSIYPDIRKRSFTRDVEVEIAPATKTSARVTRMEQRTFEEDYVVWMEKGKEYTGPFSSPNGVYATITAAVTDAASRGVSGAVRFLLTDPSYAETFPIVINPIAGSSAVNTVTIRPNTGVTTTVGGSSASAILKLNGASYVILDGSNSGGSTRNMTISNTNAASATAAVWLASAGTGLGATNDIVKNCVITTGSITLTTYAIMSGSTIGVAGADNDNFTVQNNDISKAYYGVYVNGTAATSAGGDDGLTISNNLIGPAAAGVNNIGFAGIWVQNALSVIISGNTLRNVVTSSGSSGAIYLSTNVNGATISQNTITGITSSASSSGTASITGLYMGTAVINATVSRNALQTIASTTSSGYGVRAIIVNTGNATSNITIANNTISDVYNYQDASAIYWTIGIDLDGTTGGVNVYFNSINLFGSHVGYSSNTTGGAAVAIYNIATGGSFNIRDNVLTNSYDNTTSTGDKSYAVYSGVAATAYTDINYNDYFVSGPTGVLGFLSADQATLAAWQTATGKDVNSISSDPFYTTSTNLQPQFGSPVLNTGTTIGGITIDYLGVTRGSPPSMGAYEQGTGDIVPPTITYTALGNTGSTSNRTLTATITDGTGVAGAGNAPRIYYRKGTSGSYVFANATTIVGSDYTFTINNAAIGGVTGGDIIQYYVAAQDVAVVPNGGTNPAGGSGTNPPGTTAPPAPNSYTILLVVSSFPYTEDFEGAEPAKINKGGVPTSPLTGGTGWTTGIFSGSIYDWVRGTPAKTQIASAHSGTKAYVTLTTGTYGFGENAYVQSPIFNFGALGSDPILSFWHNFYTEAGYDAGILECSTDGGTTWPRVDSTLGTGGTFNTTNSTGWYNSSSTSGPITPLKWSGQSTTYTGNTSGWIESTTNLIGFAGKTDVRFRWRFGSDGSVSYEGWAIDDVSISVPAPMAYTSSTTTQNTANVGAGATNVQVIGMQVVTTGGLSPFNITSFTVNTNGTTNTADISNLRIYYTGLSGTFSPVGQFGSTVGAPSGSVIVGGTQTLSEGTNYFWLTYDVAPGATGGHVIDAECNSITGSAPMGTVVPTVQAPAGSRTILAPLAAGDYTVGLSLFNSVTGRNLAWERHTRQVTREVPVAGNSNQPKNPGPALTSLESPTAKVATQTIQVTEDYYVLTENGRPYTGPTFAPLGRSASAPAKANRAAQIKTEKSGISDEGMSPLTGVYSTITAAVTDLNTRGVTGPVRFMLTDASYPSETYPIVINVSGPAAPTASNTVTFKPAATVTTSISGASASGPLFKVFGTNYVTFDGSNTNGGTTRDMTIQNTSGTTPNVLWIGSNGATPITNILVKNCNLINGANTSSAVVIGSGAVLGDSGYFANITLQNNSIQKSYIGVYAKGGTALQNGTNLSYLQNSLNTSGANSISFTGLYMQGVNGATVSRNDLGNFDGTGSWDDKGIWLATGTSNAVVERNTIHDFAYTLTSGYGSQGVFVSTGITGANVVVKNNMMSSLSGDGWSYTSIPTDNTIGIVLLGTQTGISVNFNSINFNGNTLNQSSAMSMGIFLGTGSVADVRDNIIVNNLGLLSTTGYGAAGVYAQTSNAQFTASDYNDYYVNATGSGVNLIGQIAATGSPTLASWQTATASDANSKNVAVTFVSATDLHLAAPSISDANLLGTPIGGITTDFDGDGRSATSPFMGADEGGLTLAKIRVYLQGPYNGGTTLMDNTLRTSGVLTTHFGAVSVPANAVDSINVEIRNAPTAAGSTIRQFQPAWLLKDGTIKGFGDTTKSYTAYSGAPAGNYYIVIWHRNHLAIMSATAQALSNSVPATYDFTTAQSQAFGTNPMIQVGASPNIFAMYAGDGNGSTIVTTADANGVFGALLAAGYNNYDINLSGVVSTADANLIFTNLLIGSQVSRPGQIKEEIVPLVGKKSAVPQKNSNKNN